MIPCPQRDELLFLIDGELSQNRAADVEEHVDRCDHCRGEVADWRQLTGGIAAPLPSGRAARVAASVMAELSRGDGREPERERQPLAARWWLGGTAVVAAAVLLLVVAVGDDDKGSRQGVNRDLRQGAAWQPRGASNGSPLARHVDVRFYVTGPHGAAVEVPEGVTRKIAEEMADDMPREMAEEMADRMPQSMPGGGGAGGLVDLADRGWFRPGDRLLVSYLNSLPERDHGPVYLLAFVVDAGGETHWLYPAFVDAGIDPQAVRLEVSSRERLLPEAVEFDDIAPGPAQLVWVASPRRLAVSAVERLGKSERTVAEFRRRWPDAAIGAVPVQWKQNGREER